MVSGILSDAVAANTDLPIRHMARNLEMGPYSRLESVVSVAMTLGLYSCVSLLLVCANHCWNTFRIKENRKGLLHGMILYPLLIKETIIPVEIIAGCTVFAWIILTCFIVRKNSKK